MGDDAENGQETGPALSDCGEETAEWKPVASPRVNSVVSLYLLGKQQAVFEEGGETVRGSWCWK